jgi:hypothetical protein
MKEPFPDESGIPWQILDGDPLEPWLKTLLRDGFLQKDLVLPNEVPRHLEAFTPRWDEVLTVWRLEGDSPRFRQILAVNTFRKVIHDHAELDQERPQGQPRTALDAA